MFCRCPNCKKAWLVESGDFGKEFLCKNCQNKLILDTIHLAHFSLPEEIVLRLVGKDGKPLKCAGVAVSANYGYLVGPIVTDKDGKVIFTKAFFEKAQKQEVLSGLMDHKGDYSLKRYIEFSIPFKQSKISIDLENAPEAIRQNISL